MGSSNLCYYLDSQISRTLVIAAGNQGELSPQECIGSVGLVLSSRETFGPLLTLIWAAGLGDACKGISELWHLLCARSCCYF